MYDSTLDAEVDVTGQLFRGQPQLLDLISRFKLSIQEQSIFRKVQRFRGGLVFKAHRLVYHPTLDAEVDVTGELLRGQPQLLDLISGQLFRS